MRLCSIASLFDLSSICQRKVGIKPGSSSADASLEEEGLYADFAAYKANSANTVKLAGGGNRTSSLPACYVLRTPVHEAA